MKRPDTRWILAEAFVDLLKKNSYEAVSVTDIVKACDASRQSFYNYFHDKNDLAVWIARQDAGYDVDHPSARPFKVLELDFLRAIKHRQNFYRKAYATREQNSLLHTTLGDGNVYLSALVEQQQQKPLTDEQRFYVQAMTYTLALTRRNWVQNGCNVPPETLMDWIMGAVPAPLKPFLLSTEIF